MTSFSIQVSNESLIEARHAVRTPVFGRKLFPCSISLFHPSIRSFFSKALAGKRISFGLNLEELLVIRFVQVFYYFFIG